MAHVTSHAAKRTKERLGLPKRVSAKNAEKALQFGIRHSETSGGLSQLEVAQELFGLEMDTMKYWVDIISTEIRLVKAVMKSDRERYKKLP